jgi:phosphonate transport system substrate-binding protein
MTERSDTLFKLLIAVLALFIYGCGNASDSVVVDFSKTKVVEQPGDRQPDKPTLKVAVAAMISPKETIVYYRQLLDYIGKQLGKDIQLVQRKTYGEINELFSKNEIDLAFVCSGPYVSGKEKFGFEAIAVPQVQGKPSYQSYLIVNKDSSFHKLEDLKNHVFAFTDPDSNTGKLVPTFWLLQMGETPETYFKKFIYTYSHDNSILAVSKSLVDGASVDGHIWEYYNKRNNAHTSRTRIIKRSQPFGNPPLVVSTNMPGQQKELILQLLFSMHMNSDGKKILNELMIDQFIEPEEELYEPIQLMKKHLGNTIHEVK